jgi:hypothetical protein
MTKRRKVRVHVTYERRGHWTVRVAGTTACDGWATIVVADYSTRDAGNEYAKGLRKALR